MTRLISQRILVVEDEPAILDLVGQVLEEEGYDVTRAANGAIALEAISTGAAFDLVVLDMWMPIMNGWQFAEALAEQGMQLPLIVMTAAKDARAYATAVGAVGFIGKPFNLDQLVLAVRDGAPPPGDGGQGASTPPVAYLRADLEPRSAWRVLRRLIPSVPATSTGGAAAPMSPPRRLAGLRPTQSPAD